MTVKHSLLALLTTGPMYGQQLKEEFEARTGEFWPLNVGQVYTSLSRLERDGLAEALEDPDGTGRRPYAITAAGQVELDLWLRSSSEADTPPRHELVMKVMISLSVDPDDARDVIQSHRRQLIESMSRYTKLKIDPGLTTPQLMMADAEIGRLEAQVRWLDLVESRMRAGARLPEPQPVSPSSPERLPAADPTAPATGQGDQ